MQDRLVYEYAVIRIVPQVEREEFLNVGVLLFCKGKRFLGMKWELNGSRLAAFSKVLDLEEVMSYLQAMEKICTGGKTGGPIGLLPVADRFRWLTAARSTVIQTSRSQVGLCHDPAEKLEQLFEEMVRY